MKLFLLACFLILISPFSSIADEEISNTTSNNNELNEFRLLEGKVSLFLPQLKQELPVPEYVLKIFPTRERVYYLRRPEKDDSSKIFAGTYTLATKEQSEIEIPDTIQTGSISKFQGSEGIVYLLSTLGTTTEPDFYRIDLNSQEITKKTGIIDFLVFDKKIFVIKQGGPTGFRMIDFRDREVPLTISGPPVFKKIEDGRICFISNGRETELVDIATMDNLYRYSSTITYLAPKEFNLIIEARDELPGKNARDMLFYKIFINGKEEGRTETGPPPAIKRFQMLLPANDSYHIAAEKWVLDRRRKQYIRSNNINQPPSVRIFLPGNRVIRMRLTKDGKKYRHTTEAVIQSE